MLTALIQSASVIVLPYDSTDQVNSGVLVDAVASGRPVVATAFPHAVELLCGGAGIVVDHDDQDALQTALRQVLTQPRLAGSMAAEARVTGAGDGVAGRGRCLHPTWRSGSSPNSTTRGVCRLSCNDLHAARPRHTEPAAACG